MKTIKIFASLLLTLTINNAFAQPTADFTVSDSNICVGTCVNFTDLSTGSPTSWMWDVGDGNTYFTQNPSHCYVVAGTFTVILVVSDSVGSDTLVKSNYITADDAATVNAGADQTICRNVNVYLNGSVSGITTTGVWSTLGSGTFDDSTSLMAVYAPSAADTTAGSVTLILTSTNNGVCLAVTDTMFVTILSSSAGTVTVSSTDATCGGSCDGSATATVSAGTPPYTYDWSPSGKTGQTITGECAGTVTVSVTDANTCNVSSSVTINEPTALVSTISPTNPSAPGNCDGDAGVTVSGGVPPYTYQWDDPNFQSTSVATALCAGTYNVITTDANGCTISDVATLVDSGCTLTATTSVTDATCGGGCDGSAAAYATGGTTPYTYLWNDPISQTDSVAIALCPANYAVTVTDSVGCSFIVSATVNTVSGISLSFITTDPSVQGGSDGAIDLAVTGGTVPYTYQWSNAATTQDLTNLVSGTYSVTVTDSNACTQTGAATLTDPPCTFTVSTSTVDATCGNCDGQASATVSGGTPPFAYLWDDPGAQTNSTALNLCASTYDLIVTDSGGCSANYTVTVNSAGGLTVSLSKTDPSGPGNCDGDATALPSGGTSPYTYSWNTTPAQTAATATALCAGSYCATVVDNNGCTVNSCITLDDSCGLFVSTTGTNVSCNGGTDGSATATVSGGTTPYTYNWSNGDTGSTVFFLAAGTYMVSVTDAGGCTISASVTITEPTVLVSTTTSTNTSGPGNCDGNATVSASGGTGAYTYLWSDGQTTQTAVNLCSGAYTVVTTDANGCTNSNSVTVTDPSCSFTVTTSSTDASCGNSDGTATASVSGGILPYTYLWDDVMAQTTATATGLDVGTYTVMVVDSSACAVTYSVTVNSASGMSVSVSTTNASGPGNCDGDATATVTGGLAPYTFLWDDPAAQTTSIATGLCAGNYCVVVTDNNACAINTCISIIDSSCIPPLTADYSYTSSGLTATFSDLSTGGPTSWFWDFGDGFNSTMQNPSHTYTSSGSYTGCLTVSNSCGSDTYCDTVTVTGSPCAVNISVVSTTDASCSGCCDGAVDISVSGGTAPYSYAWSTGDSTQDLAGLCAGTYCITVTDANSCIQNSCVVINDTNCTFTLSLAGTDNSCNAQCDGSATATPAGGTAPYTYLWDDPGNQMTSTAVNLCAGTYSVTVTDANGCNVNGTVTINEPLILSAIATGTNENCSGDSTGSATVTAAGGTGPYTYTWDDPNMQTNSTATGLTTGFYTAIVTDANGCTSGDTTVVDFIDDDCVWPGDANSDGIANNLDLLPIGIGYGTTDSLRPGATLNWVGQPASSWADTLNSGTNYKHIDCNGDGIIDDIDTLAITLNYGQVHNKGSIPNKATATDPDLYLDINMDTVSTGTQLSISLMLGTSSVPADSVYGLAFTINYDPTLIDTSSATMSFANSWLGTEGTDMISIQHDFYADGKIEIAVTRTDHNNVDGFGQIGVFGIITIDNLSGKVSLIDTIVFVISDVTIISNDETIKNVNLGTASVIIEDIGTGIDNYNEVLSSAIKVYPNPASDVINIEINDDININKITLTNMLGELIKEITHPVESKLLINTGDYSNGVYFLKIETKEGLVVKKLSIVN